MAIYIHIPHQNGNATTKGYQGWTQANGFSFAANRDIQTVAGHTGNRISSHVLANEIHIFKHVDQLSPFLFGEACTGKAISKIKIEVVSDSGLPLIQYTLDNVIISEYDAFIIADDVPLEAIAFNFTHLEVRYFSHEKNSVTPVSAKMKTGSQPSLNSQIKRSIASRTEDGFKLFVATVYGEACGQSDIAWQAVASTIINRVDNKYFKVAKHTLPTAEKVITQRCWYEAYYKKRESFTTAYSYLKGESQKKPLKIDSVIATIHPIYFKNLVTTNADHYYSPKTQREGHKKHPEIYLSDIPKWVTDGLKSGELIEINILGLTHKDDFKFYKKVK